MTKKLPALRGRVVIAALEKAGFVAVRSKGSHRMLQHIEDAAKRVVVPDHGAKDLKHGTLLAIIKQAGLTVDEFKELL